MTTSGVCAGLSVASAFYFLISKHHTFNKLILSIASYSKEKLKNDLMELKKRKIEPKYIRTKEDDLLSKIRFLFEIIAAYSEPQAFHKLFKKFILQPKISEISEALKKIYNKPAEIMFFRNVNVGHFPIMLELKSKVDLQYKQFLLDIHKAAKVNPPCQVAFILDSLEHRVTLNYDGVSDKWFSDDLKHLDRVGQEVLYDQLTAHIFKKLRASNKDKYVDVETFVFTAPINANRFSKCFRRIKALAFFSLKNDVGAIRKTSKNVTLLHLAAKFGETDIINKIKDETLLNMSTNGGLTPLLIAAEQDQTKTVQALLANKADPSITLNDMTPFRYATRYENHEMMDMLKKAKMPLDKPNDAKIGEKRKTPSSFHSLLPPPKTTIGSHYFHDSPNQAVPGGINLYYKEKQIYIQKDGEMILVLTSLQAQLNKQKEFVKKRLKRSFLLPV